VTPGTPYDSRRASASAALLVVVIALTMQTGSALAARLIESVGVVGALWLRTALAALLLGAIRPRSVRLPPVPDRLPVAALTVTLLVMNLSFYAAISRAPLGVVVAVEFLGPLAVAVLGSRRPVDFVWVGLAGVGVVLLAGPTSDVSTTGLLFALCAACAWRAGTTCPCCPTSSAPSTPNTAPTPRRPWRRCATKDSRRWWRVP